MILLDHSQTSKVLCCVHNIHIVGRLSNTSWTNDCSALTNFTWMTYHYDDVIMGTIVSQITSPTIVNSIVYSDADQRKHQRSASLAFVRGIHWGPVNSPHKWPVTRKMFPFDDVIMITTTITNTQPKRITYPSNTWPCLIQCKSRLSRLRLSTWSSGNTWCGCP